MMTYSRQYACKFARNSGNFKLEMNVRIKTMTTSAVMVFGGRKRVTSSIN